MRNSMSSWHNVIGSRGPRSHPNGQLVRLILSPQSVRLSARAMKEIEARVERRLKLGKEFPDNHGDKPKMGKVCLSEPVWLLTRTGLRVLGLRLPPISGVTWLP